MIVVIEKYFYSDQEYSTDVRGVFGDIEKARLEVFRYFASTVNAFREDEGEDMIMFRSRPLGEQILIEFKEMKINELCT
jgi:hypothetical protein